jgi:hypothetical protein
MASSYTSNTGIEKPGTGDQSGTWGTTTNLNFDIIDRALNGVGSITLSGTTHTLTTSDGTLSDGMFRVLVLGGSPSGTNTITISPNDAQKFYVVVNSSGQSAVLSQGSGANTTVANGQTRLVYADGAGSGAAVVDLSSTLQAQVAAGALNIVDDTSPQLGGNLDVNGNEISSASNGNVVVNPNGTGTIELEAATNVTGNVQITGTTTIVGNLVPDGDGTRDLGTTSVRFANIFGDNFTTGDLILDNTSRDFNNDVDGTCGRWRIQEGAADLFIMNELTGTKYKFKLERV